MSGASTRQYSIDTSSLIDGYKDADTRAVLEKLIKGGRLKAPPGVLRELKVVDDKPLKWVIYLSRWLLQELTSHSNGKLGPLLDKYGEPFQDPQEKGKTYRGLIKKGTAEDADPEVIGLAIDHDWTVVTGDGSIKGACKLEAIDCLSLEGLLQIEGSGEESGEKAQLSLNLDNPV